MTAAPLTRVVPRPFLRGRALRWAGALALAWLSQVAHAQTDPATAEQMLRKSGLWVQMASVAEALRDGMASGPQALGARASPSEPARLQALAA